MNTTHRARLGPLRRAAIVVTMALAAACLGGCAHVDPWERGTLGAPGMISPPCALVGRENLHVLTVREASRGGYGMVGGGCGCN